MSSAGSRGLLLDRRSERASRQRACWPGTGLAGHIHSWSIEVMTPLTTPPVCVVYKISLVAALDAVSMALPSAAAEGSPGSALPGGGPIAGTSLARSGRGYDQPRPMR